MTEKRILIVDPDPKASEQIASTCRNFNFRVGLAQAGNDLLEMLEENKPDLIILSVELPDVNGFVLCKKIKTDTALRKIPLILVSTQSDQAAFEKHRKLKDSADGYLLKPFSGDDLIDQVEQLVGLPPPPSSKEIIDKKLAMLQAEALERETELKRTVEKKEREINMLRESFENVSSKLERAKADFASAQEALASAETKIQKMTREHQQGMAKEESKLKSLTQEHEEEREQWELKNQSLLDRIEELVSRNTEMQKELESLNRRSELTEQENAKREANLKERIKELLAQVDEEKQSLQEMKKKFDEIEETHTQELTQVKEEAESTEQEKVKMEQRVVKAYKKIKMDQVRDEKIQKALDIALSLLKNS